MLAFLSAQLARELGPKRVRFDPSVRARMGRRERRAVEHGNVRTDEVFHLRLLQQLRYAEHLARLDLAARHV